MKKILYLLPFLCLSSALAAQKDKTTEGIYDMGGRKIIDRSLEVTGALQADKWFELINASTPSTPAATHARFFYNNAQQKLCVVFGDGTQSCLGPGTSGGGGILAGAVQPIIYNSTTNILSATLISLSTGVINSGTSGIFTELSSATFKTTVGIEGQINEPLTLTSSETIQNNFGVTGQVNLPMTHTSSVTIQGNLGIIGQVNQPLTLTSSETINANLQAQISSFTTIFGNSETLSNGLQINGQGSNYLALVNGLQSLIINAPASLPVGYTLTLPSAQGAANSVLQDDGAGVLTWASSITVRGYLSATQPIIYNSNTGVISATLISLSTGVTGVLPDANITNTFTSSKTITSSNGLYVTYGASLGSATLRNVASGTQCIHADSSGNLTGTGSDCGSSGGAALASTQTFTGSNTFANAVIITSNSVVTSSTNACGYLIGTVVQSSHSFSNNDFSTTSNSFQTTNLTAIITPKCVTDVIFITAQGSWENVKGSVMASRASLFRGSTNLGAASVGMFRHQIQNTTATWVPLHFAYLDTPATTSATTYSVKILSDDNATASHFGDSNDTQVMELLEIAR